MWKHCLYLVLSTSIFNTVSSGGYSVTEDVEENHESSSSSLYQESSSTSKNTTCIDKECGKNERYVDCPMGQCIPKNCSQLGIPIPCPRIAPPCPGGCLCIKGYVWDDNGVCIPSEKCPNGCGGDPNAEPGCGTYCNQRCSDINGTRPCPEICQINGCKCRGDYLYDDNLKKCVKRDACTPKCEANEEYSTCILGECKPLNCSQLGYPVPCPKIDPRKCKGGCICTPGYLRHENGTCIPQNDCPDGCGGDCNAVSGCGSHCGKRCSDYKDRKKACPYICKLNGCDCAKGYVYDDNQKKCVKPEDCAPTCPTNEVFSKCRFLECRPKNCSEVGKPIGCPSIVGPCDDPGCICIEGYARDDSGICIPVKECPTCNGDPNAVAGCGNHCGKSCSDYNTTVLCPFYCKLNGCDCRKDYVYDANVDKCVLPCDCTTQCTGQNEKYDTCLSTCGQPKCSNIGVVYGCPLQPVPGSKDCKKGCRCEDNYYRNANNVCVTKEECQKCKDPKEVWADCPKTCPPQTCKSLNHTYHCPLQDGKQNCKAQCICAIGYYRNLIGECISEEDCLKCQGDHEYYSCGGACDNVCRTLPYQNQTSCPIVNVKCNERCYCEKGYARNDNGDCVPFKDCEPPCGKNEEYDCISSCPGDNCANSTTRIAACPCDLDKICKKGCKCKSGYYRNKKNVCVPYDKCPPPKTCPEEEVLDKCPPEDPCDGELCPASRDSPQSCPKPEKCGRPQCVCRFNYHRDRKTGKCIPTTDCPPFPCDGPNEEYRSCPPGCPGETCKDYLNNATCPKYKIGIVVPCKPQCKCKKGYYRDLNDVCIEACQCADSLNVKENKTTTTTTTTTTTVAPSTTTEEETKALAKGNADFTAEFYYEVAKNKPGESIIMSPFSVLFPLALLCLFSQGQSHKQLLHALNLENNDQIRNAFPVLISETTSQQSVILNLALKLYINKLYPVTYDFKHDAEKYFDSEAENIDYSNPKKAANKINTWVEEKTNDLIHDLVSPSDLSLDTRVVITNAIYFKGDWKHQFNPNNTKKRDYHVDNNTTIQVDTMYQKQRFMYTENEKLDAKILQLPYKGGNMSCVIILPNKIEGLCELQEKLKDTVTLEKALESLKSAEVNVYLPKIKIETEINLKDVLKKMGITKIFNETDSGLVGISKKDEKLYVSSATQKAFIEINETGSEAAAANALVVGTTSALPPPNVRYFKADHPFAFYILLQNKPIFCGSYTGQ